MNASEIQAELRKLARPDKAVILARFFKTGKGEYGEGDRFLGVVVPEQRRIVKKYLSGRSTTSCSETLRVVQELLRGEIHEERLTALLLLVEQFKRASAEEQASIFDFYLKNLRYVNNWDLVDLSAPNIVGAFLLDKDPALLYTLAESEHLWTRRVAVLATFAFIRAGRFEPILTLAESLLIEKRETHDLMQKAVGWMLREAGKRDETVMTAFLDRFSAVMPRTALRYSIERLPEPARRKYLHNSKPNKKVNPS